MACFIVMSMKYPAFIRPESWRERLTQVLSIPQIPAKAKTSAADGETENSARFDGVCRKKRGSLSRFGIICPRWPVYYRGYKLEFGARPRAKGGRRMPVIYLDVLLALNLFIDFLLLLATARLLRLPYRRWRLVLGALAGAASACLIFLPDLSALAAAGLKLLAAGILLLIAFAWRGLWSYIKTLTVFFVSSTLFAGVAAALWFFAAPQGFYVVNGVVYYDVPPLLLVFLTVVSYGALCLFDRFVRKKRRRTGSTGCSSLAAGKRCR